MRLLTKESASMGIYPLQPCCRRDLEAMTCMRIKPIQSCLTSRSWGESNLSIVDSASMIVDERIV